MTESAGKYKERVVKRLQGIKEKFTGGMKGPIIKPDKIEQEINAELGNCLDFAIGWLSNNGQLVDVRRDRLEELIAELRRAWLADRNGVKIGRAYISGYQRMHKLHLDIQDELRLERNADWGEKLRALLFRVVTTGLVGFVILGIYYLAHIWKIPVPLARLPIS